METNDRSEEAGPESLAANETAQAEEAGAEERHSRRRFLGMVGVAAATASAGTVRAGEPSIALPNGAGEEKGFGGGHGHDDSLTRGPRHTRGVRAHRSRLQANQFLLRRQPDHPNNGDERRYANKIASFSKALPHNALGEVDLNAYRSMIRALDSGRPSDFENIQFGGPRTFTSPQASLAFSPAWLDSHYSVIPPAPRFDSAEQAAEMAEDYWHMICRDVPFTEYGTNPLTIAAAADLSTYSDYRAPKSGGVVIPDYLFRGNTPGDLVGPYISQFLLKPFNMGSNPVQQKVMAPTTGLDFMTDYPTWLAIQNGQLPAVQQTFEPAPRYMINGRDLGWWVHQDNPILAGMNALYIIAGFGPSALDDANPAKPAMLATGIGEMGFVTFGGPDLIDNITAVGNLSMKCTWFQKWQVHRRLRPEAYAGRVHNHKLGLASYPLHAEILNSAVLDEVFARQGTYLLGQEFVEGSPTHPSYSAGHATFAGATCTILKALFREDFVIPNPVVPSADGGLLLPYAGPPLTIGGELNKLAANVALGRNIAGVHWRSDGINSILFGEKVAIEYLKTMKTCYNEDFDGYSLTKFDGATITI